MSSAYIPKKLRKRVAHEARYRCGYCCRASKRRWRRSFLPTGSLPEAADAEETVAAAETGVTRDERTAPIP